MRTAAFAVLLFLAGCAQGGPAPESRVVEPGADEVYILEPGRPYDPDRVPGIKRLDRRAANGDVAAQHQVAFLRHFMAGNHAQAVAEFKRLAEGGHLASMQMLALAYRDGKGVAADYERAAYWLEQAADRGDERAARDLAAYRSHRESVAPDQ